MVSLFCHVDNNCVVNTPGEEDVIFFSKVTLVGYELKEIGNESHPDGLRYYKDGGNFNLLVEDILDPHSNQKVKCHQKHFHEDEHHLSSQRVAHLDAKIEQGS